MPRFWRQFYVWTGIFLATTLLAGAIKGFALDDEQGWTWRLVAIFGLAIAGGLFVAILDGRDDKKNKSEDET